MTTNTHFSSTGKARPGGPERIPFVERLTCSVDDATKVSGLSSLDDLQQDEERRD